MSVKAWEPLKVHRQKVAHREIDKVSPIFLQ
jgi:hypothetical protein